MVEDKREIQIWIESSLLWIDSSNKNKEKTLENKLNKDKKKLVFPFENAFSYNYKIEGCPINLSMVSSEN